MRPYGAQDRKQTATERLAKMDRRLFVIPLVLAVAAAGGGAYWWWSGGSDVPAALVLFGNVDLRQVALPFNNSERIAEVLVEEGDHVRRGQVLARLDVSRLKPQVDQAEAQVAAQRAVVERLRNGSRPEEIAQARANIESAKANAFNLRRQYERKKALVVTLAAAQQDVDIAKVLAEGRPAEVFDLHSLPAAIRLITYLFPARYYVALLQTILLAGNVWAVILPNAAVLAGMATVLFALTQKSIRKRLA
jgi:multidrug resistance efflux pump